MIDVQDTKNIEEFVEEFLSKMTMVGFSLSVNVSGVENKDTQTDQEVVMLEIKMPEPKFLIGQNGQTLVELERILRILLSRKLQKNFYLKVDINDYQKNKIEHLKTMARELADEVSLTKQEKALPAMSAYERRIVHMELSTRKDVATRSEGDELYKHIVISVSN